LLEILLQWLEFLGLISTEGDRIVGARDREGPPGARHGSPDG
jgi:hypothetical protein